ncbi:MAG: hypothetical protein FWB95_07320 [Treponema sp.]|nr:hypothetical protein [Treponema sp.]
MVQRIHISKVNDSASMCFDTGLEPRSFARTKMSQSLIEQGYVVNPDGSHEIWKASGVNEINGCMTVFGPAVHGKRLDILLEETEALIQSAKQTAQRQIALQAVVYWIKAKMFLGETRSVLNLGASFICMEDTQTHPKGSVYFAPEHLSTRCLYLESARPDQSLHDKYNCPDLFGMDASAFCAGVMLYKILTGNQPYSGLELYQDMREGIFMPVQPAAPELNEKLAELIQSALLLPVLKKRPSMSGTDILSNILEILIDKTNTAANIDSLYAAVPLDKTKQAEKESKNFLLKKNVVVKTRRFMASNKHLIIGCAIGLFFALFILFSTLQGVRQRPTTSGLSPDRVVTAYFDAFSSLDHFYMEACINGADKTDVNAAASFYAVFKQRQAYEGSGQPLIIQARAWKENGGALPAPNVFGVTDLVITYVGGNEEDGLVVYRADYLLWAPTENHARNRSDVMTLKTDRKRHWRIIEILRTEK